MTVGAAVMAWKIRVWMGAPITRIGRLFSSSMLRTGFLPTTFRTPPPP
jgi:hypothetical protein